MHFLRQILLAIFGCTLSFAQSQLVVDEAGTEFVVVGFDGTTPLIVDKLTGTLRNSPSRQFRIKEAQSFGDGIIELRGITVFARNHSLVKHLPRPDDLKAQPMSFSTEYFSKTTQSSLFVTFELKGHGVLVARALPPLAAEKWVKLELDQTIPERDDSAPPFDATVRFFSNGEELQKAASPLENIQVISDLIIAKIIKEKNYRNSKLKVHSRVNPIYPKQLESEGIRGAAQIRCVIEVRGRVSEASILSASHPDFGEAALLAAKLWRFIPEIKSGEPVESKVTIPFNFSSPDPNKKPAKN